MSVGTGRPSNTRTYCHASAADSNAWAIAPRFPVGECCSTQTFAIVDPFPVDSPPRGLMSSFGFPRLRVKRPKAMHERCETTGRARVGLPRAARYQVDGIARTDYAPAEAAARHPLGRAASIVDD